MTIELNTVDVHVGERIRARRLLVQMSEEWLAGFLEISVSDLSAIEEGKLRIAHGSLMRCAEALGVAERYFYTDFGSKTRERASSKPWYREIDRWFAVNLFPHEGLLMRTAIRITGNRETAREIVQDTYLSLVRDDNWRLVQHPRSYVTQAVRHLAWRKLERSRIVPIELVANMEEVDRASIDPDAHELVSTAQRRQIVLDAIEALPPKCRRVVKLRRLKEMSPNDIAAEMGISVKMVEKHLAKGMAVIAKRLGEPYPKHSTSPRVRLDTASSE